MRTIAVLAVILLAAPPGQSQSLNVDFGTAQTAPSPGYAAAGLPGVWNAYGLLPEWERFPLVDLAGDATEAEIYMFGPTDLLILDDPGTSGDDASLLDDMLIGFNDPVDVCVWFEGLENGDYEVLTYAMTPADPELLHRIRVDDGDPGPVWIGGTWPGDHEESVTFARHTVPVVNGVLALHSGEWAAAVESGINGIQIRLETSASSEETRSVPGGPRSLRSVYPNPAGGSQFFDLRLAEGGPGRLEILDVTGRLVWRRDLGRLEAGDHVLTWDGRDLTGRAVPASVYFVRLAGGRSPAAGSAGAVKLLRVE